MNLSASFGVYTGNIRHAPTILNLSGTPSRNDAVERKPPIGNSLVVDENNAIVGPTLGSPNGGRNIPVQSQWQINRHRLHRATAFPARGQRHFLWLAASVPLGRATHGGAAPSAATSNNHLLPIEKALAFMHGLLCDAGKLTHVAYLRRDPLVPEVLGITRVPSQTALARFFQGFTAAGVNLRCFRPLWHWGLDRLPSRQEDYTLDLVRRGSCTRTASRRA